MTMDKNARPLVIGEVLFDCFPDGSAVLGGAPFNVAWHLQGFGLAPLMISSVGDDAHGKRVLELMRQWGMDARGVQTDALHPTGEVKVSLEDGQPSYDIRADQAYDHISVEQLQPALENQAFSLLYHGSLLTRTPHSRAVIEQLLEATAAKLFVDINLRPPWWDTENVQRALQKASWVKLNEDELLTIMQVDSDSTMGLFEHAKQMQEEFALDLLIVTQGELGAFFISPDDMISGSPVAANVVDTVGAGDSFSAVTILGLIQNWPLAVILERALEFAAKICEQRGATKIDQALYGRYLEKWAG